jgi:hypothetical protein
MTYLIRLVSTCLRTSLCWLMMQLSEIEQASAYAASTAYMCISVQCSAFVVKSSLSCSPECHVTGQRLVAIGLTKQQVGQQ